MPRGKRKRAAASKESSSPDTSSPRRKSARTKSKKSKNLLSTLCAHLSSFTKSSANETLQKLPNTLLSNLQNYDSLSNEAVILVTSNVLSLLSKNTSNSTSTSVQEAAVMIHLAHLLFLNIEKATLEKVILQNDICKTILGKTLLNILAATVKGYSILTSTMDTTTTTTQQHAEIISTSIAQAISTLEGIMEVKRKNIPPPSEKYTLSIPMTNQHAHSIPMSTFNQFYWNELMEKVNPFPMSMNTNGDSDSTVSETVQNVTCTLEPFLQQVSTTIESTIPKSKKKTGHVLDLNLLASGPAIEGRVNVKKFVSMAFAHCCAGQYHLLVGLQTICASEFVTEQQVQFVIPGNGGGSNSSSTTTTGRKKGKKKTSTSANASTTTNVNVTSSLMISILASRIIDVIQESGKLCATFPQRNGMEEYIASLHNFFENVVIPSKKNSKKSSTSSSSVATTSPSKRARKPDISALAIATIQSIMKNHQQCLYNIAEFMAEELASPKKNATNAFQLATGPETSVAGYTYPDTLLHGYVLVNEEEVNTKATSLVHAFGCYNPMTFKMIETLVRCSSSAFSDKSDFKVMTAIVAAFALKSSKVLYRPDDKKVPLEDITVVDAKLSSFALSSYNDVVSGLVSHIKTSLRGDSVDKAVKDLNADLIHEFALNTPLVPDLNTFYADLLDENASALENSMEDKGWRNGILLSIFFRANLEEGITQATKDQVISSVVETVTSMLDIVRTCYTIKTVPSLQNSEKIKQTKCITRCTLAADCFDAIHKSIEHVSYSPSVAVEKEIKCVSLRSAVRSLVPTSAAKAFIGLGEQLETNLVRNRLIWDLSKEENSPSSSRQGSKLEFEQWERRVWSSHIKCCLAFVRGRASFISKSSTSNSSNNKRKSVFGTSSERLELFSMLGLVTTCSETKWPLYLSPLHHALVTSQLTSDPLPRTVKDAAPEKFICDGFIESILDSFGDPSTNIISRFKIQENRDVQSSDEEIPLSIRDARLFAVAMSRLPKKEQLPMIAKLVNVLHEGVQILSDNEAQQEMLNSSNLFSGFLARAITITSIIIDMVSSGTTLLESLCDFIGPLHYHLPSFIKSSNSDPTNSFWLGGWYNRESCYMGIWPDWEASALPSSTEMSTFVEALAEEDVVKFQQLLEKTMELGFNSARCDKSLLLYASWNASAKISYFDSKTWTAPTSLEDLASSSSSNANKLLTLYKDVCGVVQALGYGKSFSHSSFLTKQIERKQRQGLNESMSLIEQGNLVKSAGKHSIQLVQNLMQSQENNETDSGTFTVIEASLAYLSFITSMYTKCDKDLISVLQKENTKRRKSSDISDDGDCSEASRESEDYNNFEDDEEEAHMDAFNRLHDMCEVMGAAPFHPDWLDDSCRLRYSITEASAIEFAESALDVLTKFGLLVFEEYFKLLSELISNWNVEDMNGTIDGDSVLATIRGIMANKSDNDEEEPLSWQGDVLTAFNIEKELTAAIANGMRCKNSDAVKESFTLNSSHRIKGKLQDYISAGSGLLPSSAELRVGSEWELLLSDSLVGPSCTLDLKSIDESLLNDDSSLLRWKRVLQSILDAMVPVNALLRFALNGSKGRTQHRVTSLSIDSNDSSLDVFQHLAYQSSPIRAHIRAGSVASSNIETSQLKASVNKALCLFGDIQSCGFLHKSLHQTARSAACHLLSSDRDFLRLEGIHSIRNALVAMSEFASSNGMQQKRKIFNFTEYIADRLDTLQQTVDGFETLFLLCLGASKEIQIDTITECNLNLETLVKSNSTASKYGWDWDVSNKKEISFLIEAILGKHKNIINAHVRSLLINFVMDAIKEEERNGSTTTPSLHLKQLVLKSISELNSTQIQFMVKNDLCISNKRNTNADSLVLQGLSLRLCSLLVSLFSVQLKSDKKVVEAFASILKSLKNCMQHWLGREDLDHVTSLVCVLSLHADKLDEVHSEMFKLIDKKKGKQDELRLTSLEPFYRFLRDTKKHLSSNLVKIESGIDGSNKKDDANEDMKALVGKSCTFGSTHGEFTEQHWYNCFTCGLTWDKGCCSFCVQVCHKGHDVGYSRKSSFFCDCGAQVSTNVGRIVCKCLSPISQATISSLKTQASNTVSYRNSYTCGKSLEALKRSQWNSALRVVASHFKSTASSSIEKFVASMDKNLVSNLFDNFRTSFASWSSHDVIPDEVTSQMIIECDEGGHSFRARNGVPLKFTLSTDGSSFTPLRLTKTGTINTGIVSEYSLQKSQRQTLTKNSIERRIIVSDGRGRLVIGETKSLLFVGGIPAINTRHVPNSIDTSLSKTELSVLGNHSLDFGITGVSLCPSRDRHLLAWGLTKAQLLVMNKTFQKVDFSIKLDVNVSTDSIEGDSDYIIKTDWITESIVFVVCATCVKIFDIKTKCKEESGTFTCQPSAVYALAYDEVLIRSAALVPCEENEEFTMFSRLAATLYLLFDTGRLQQIQLDLDENMKLAVQGTIDLEYGDSVLFPIAGVKRFTGSTAETSGSKATTFGEEGLSLVYLKQAKLLLYKCISYPMIAFTLDAHGEIDGNFEFLPNTIETPNADANDSDSIVGPYYHWTEIGTIRRDDKVYHRAIFTGKSRRTNQPKLLCIEFNDHESKITKVQMPSNSNLSLGSASSFEGLAAFTAPLVTDSKGMLESQDASPSESLFIATLLSNGTLTFHGEDEDDHRTDTPAQFKVHFKESSTTLPEFPLTMFESLDNITSSDEVIISGDGLHENSKSTKRKLLTGSNDYIISRTREGCSFNFRIEKKTTSQSNLASSSQDETSNSENIVIVAVRILLGSHSMDFTPKSLHVMGRAIKPLKQKRRWYDIPLTDEEILLASRNGFVPVFIGGGPDSDRSQAYIDSIEIYGKKRIDLPHIFARSNQDVLPPKPNRTSLEHESELQKFNSIMIISHVLQLLASNPDFKLNINQESLQLLIQVTALEKEDTNGVRSHVVALMKDIEPDQESMQKMLDKGTIHGIFNVLKEITSFLENFASIPVEACEKNMSRLFECIEAALLILKERPASYKTSVEELVSSSTIDSSIASCVLSMIKEARNSKVMMHVQAKLVELIIYEVSVSRRDTSQSSNSPFASVLDVCDLLTTPDEASVKSCCSEISRVLRDENLVKMENRRQQHQHSLSDYMDIDEGDDVQLAVALRMSLEESQEKASDENQSTLSLVFNSILHETLGKDLSYKKTSKVGTLHILNLLLTLVANIDKEDERVSLGTTMCEELMKTIKEHSTKQSSSPDAGILFTIISYLKAITALLSKRSSIPDEFKALPQPSLHVLSSPSLTSSNKTKTDPRFVCETHGVPAVRRRCSSGEHKDRRFYVCGMSRRNRCKYFKWADEVDDLPSKGKETQPRKVEVELKLSPVIWRLLNDGENPLHKDLCIFLRQYIKKAGNVASHVSGSLPALSTTAEVSASRKISSILARTTNTKQDFIDGVSLSKEKLGLSTGSNRIGTCVSFSLNNASVSESLLDLLALLGPDSVTENPSTSWETWYSPLCYIISKEFPPDMRSRAKEMLKCITGGKRSVYRKVRDSFVFASQFFEVLASCQSPLQDALHVRERALQCGPNWRDAVISFKTLDSGSLIGVVDLISEDNYPVVEVQKTLEMVKNLISTIAKSKLENWRNFCTLEKLPRKDTDLEGPDSSSLIHYPDLYDCSPISLLFWIACSVPEKVQPKIFSLLDMALTTKTIPKPNAEESPNCKLVIGEKKLTLNDICGFSKEYVVNGRSKECRSLAGSITGKLLSHTSSDMVETFLKRMSSLCMEEIGIMGENSIEFITLLTKVISRESSDFEVDATELLQVAVKCFISQVDENVHTFNNALNTSLVKVESTNEEPETFDLAKCIHCQFCQPENLHISPQSDTTIISSSENIVHEKIPEQLTCFRKMRIALHNTVSTEFCSFVQLKTRLAIRELSVNVSDQRGRYVKTINVFFTPRPVNNVNELKEDDYEPYWQPCGSLTLTRGVAKATLKLPPMVVASNLKFEYADFYEKVTGQRTSSGAMVLHCPRCTRVVSNALGGVCGHCGEVAFQCRKCRHINYDRLDAFLCVECGYCSSGSFSYEVVAGEAISAVAILDNKDLKRVVNSLHSRNRKCTELKGAFEKEVSKLKDTGGNGKKRPRAESELDKEISSFSPQLKRALKGEFPDAFIGKAKPEKSESKEAEPSSSPNRASASSRARSLLNLARSLRGDGDSEVRSSLSDLLAQQARLGSRGRNSFPFDDDDDIIIHHNPGEGNIMHIEMHDPISRLVANIQARSRARGDRNEITSTGNKEKKKDGNTKSVDAAKKYVMQINGIERDCFEITRRITAWERLNQDALADYGSDIVQSEYKPVKCTKCARAVTNKLLELVVALVSNTSGSINSILSRRLLQVLFESGLKETEDIIEMKRSLIVAIARKSLDGSKMVLDELHRRIEVRDANCAEILSRLVKGGSKVHSHSSFVDLTITTLNSN